MKWLVRLYPREWRDRYGPELEDILEQTPNSLGNVLDTVKGAVLMHAFSPKNPAKLIFLTGLFGAVLMFLATFSATRQYVSDATMKLLVHPDTIGTWLNGETLIKLRDRRGLYPGADINTALDHFKKRIEIRWVDGREAAKARNWQGNLRLRFTDPDPERARTVTNDLLESLQASHIVEVLEPARQPQAAPFPERPLFAATGLFGGMLFAAVGSFAVRKIRSLRTP